MRPNLSVCQLFWAVIVSANPCGLFGRIARAEELVTISRQKLDELTSKAREADRLAAEVTDLKSKIQQLENRLQAGNSAQVAGTTPVPANTAPNSPAIRAPLPDPTQWPPLDTNSVISMAEVLAHFSANPSAANSRYQGKHLRIRGTITAFDRPMFVSYYQIVFREPTLSARATVRVYPPVRFKRVYATSTGEQMIGEAAGLAPAVLAKVGSDVIIEGRCAGVRNGVVSIVDASVVNATETAPAR